MNYIPTSDALRMEIAILQEDINSQNPGVAKFKIPVLVPSINNETIYTNGKNIINKNRIGTASLGYTNVTDILTLKVPKEYTVFYGADIVPKGTRFIVAFIGGNINDIKIISRYDSLEE